MKKKQLRPGQYFGPLALVHVAAAPVLQSFSPGCQVAMASQPEIRIFFLAGQELREPMVFITDQKSRVFLERDYVRGLGVC